MKKTGSSKAKYVIIAAPVILFFTFHTVPFIQGVFYSLTDWKGYGNWNFVGLRNYLHAFQDKSVLEAYKFTFKFALTATIIVNALSLLLAVGLNAKIKFKKSRFTLSNSLFDQV